MRLKAKYIFSLFSLIPLITYGQQSSNAEMEKCTNEEQIKLTAQGAIGGALLGALSAALGDNSKRRDVAKRAAIGGAAGGAAGFIYSYYNAFSTCYQKNPELIGEKKIVRQTNLEEAKAKLGYRPEMGVVVKLTAMSAPKTVNAGTPIIVPTSFSVLTPNGAEQDVIIDRKLAVRAPNEAERIIPLGASKITFEPGEHRESPSFPVPADIQAGSVIRYQVQVRSASADDSPPSTGVTTTTIN